MTEATTAPFPRRARRPLVVALVVLLALAVLVVAADVITRRVAEDRMATVLQEQLGLEQTPGIRIDGTPFLTQLASRDFTRIGVTAEHAVVTAQGRRVELSDVDLSARSVVASADWTSFTAARIDGSVGVGWDQTSRLIGARVEHAPPAVGGSSPPSAPNGADRVRISQTIDFQGVSIPVVLVGTPRYDADSGRILLPDAEVQIATYTLPAALVQQLLARALQPLDLGLPPGLAPTELESTPQGLRVRLAGTDVVLQ